MLAQLKIKLDPSNDVSLVKIKDHISEWDKKI